MKRIKTLLPNLSIALSLALVVILIVDRLNPFMGFLRSGEATVLIVATALVSTATALLLYIETQQK